MYEWVSRILPIGSEAFFSCCWIEVVTFLSRSVQVEFEVFVFISGVVRNRPLKIGRLSEAMLNGDTSEDNRL